MNILISPNSFKNSLSAVKCAAAICAGFKESDLPCECTELPIADGGDGTLEVVARYLNAQVEQVRVRDPFGRIVTAKYGWNASEKIGLIELAEASGLKLLGDDTHNPLSATTYGTGQLICEVLDRGAKKIFLTLGGSATVDGGIGVLSALGAIYKGHDENITADPLPSDLCLISGIDLRQVKERLKGAELIILCDVKNPLLGPEGAATVFGPQKGATPEGVQTLEKGLAHLADVIEHMHGVNVRSVQHGGSAGGVAAILYGLLDAKLVDGAEQILGWARFDEALKSADLVVTAEGQIDEQTDYGKGPGLVAKKAKEAGKVVIGLSGSVQAKDLRYKNFDMVLPITSHPGKLSIAFANTATNLKRTAFQLGQLLHALNRG